MIDLSSFAVFVPTFFLVSISPGLCMTLAMTLGMTIGVRKTLWMMLGELLGVALVAFFAVVGVATMMLQYPTFFQLFKYIGGLYLGFTGVQMWLSKGKMAIVPVSAVPLGSGGNQSKAQRSNMALVSQGFVAAIANPKGWAFMISLLPPFINETLPLTPQLSLLLVTVLLIEFICLMLYTVGGKQLGRLLLRNNNVGRLNRITGSLMIGVGIWLAFG
jgi:threonine/homoserine/homoserine lactone efflux protein